MKKFIDSNSWNDVKSPYEAQGEVEGVCQTLRAELIQTNWGTGTCSQLLAHVEIETSMARSGFSLNELEHIIRLLHKLRRKMREAELLETVHDS